MDTDSSVRSKRNHIARSISIVEYKVEQSHFFLECIERSELDFFAVPFTSVGNLVGAITSYINEHNTNPKSFTWTAKAEEILAKVECARAVLHNVASE
jgi:hypothetical protein